MDNSLPHLAQPSTASERLVIDLVDKVRHHEWTKDQGTFAEIGTAGHAAAEAENNLLAHLKRLEDDASRSA